jgi:hypothetical protein
VPKDSRKSFQINEQEINWRGFLVDVDAIAALPLLSRAIAATAHADRDIVREAWDEDRTIVTSNGRDFVRYIQEFQNPPNNEVCQDLWGLVVLPNLQLERERVLPSIRNGLDVQQIGLRWPAAGLMNLYVRLGADGQTDIRRFQRCPLCAHQDRGIEISEPWNAWYQSLPDVGRSVPQGR